MQPIQELIVDAYDCRADLSDVPALVAAARSAVEKVGATVAGESFHQFQPHGATVCLILKESHFIVSTWPEYGTAIVNIFLCNPDMSTRECFEYFKHALQPKEVVYQEVSHTLSRPKRRLAAR
jgi:S-adenosylmethionine decarboxylase